MNKSTTVSSFSSLSSPSESSFGSIPCYKKHPGNHINSPIKKVFEYGEIRYYIRRPPLPKLTFKFVKKRKIFNMDSSSEEIIENTSEALVREMSVTTRRDTAKEVIQNSESVIEIPGLEQIYNSANEQNSSKVNEINSEVVNEIIRNDQFQTIQNNETSNTCPDRNEEQINELFQSINIVLTQIKNQINSLITWVDKKCQETVSSALESLEEGNGKNNNEATVIKEKYNPPEEICPHSNKQVISKIITTTDTSDVKEKITMNNIISSLNTQSKIKDKINDILSKYSSSEDEDITEICNIYSSNRNETKKCTCKHNRLQHPIQGTSHSFNININSNNDLKKEIKKDNFNKQNKKRNIEIIDIKFTSSKGK